MRPGDSKPADRATRREIGTEYLLIPPLLVRPKRWHTRRELREYLYDVDPDAIDRALDDLHAEGIVHLDGEQVRASSCARHMNELVGDVIEREDER
jgi:hypothetical protein